MFLEFFHPYRQFLTERLSTTQEWVAASCDTIACIRIVPVEYAYLWRNFFVFEGRFMRHSNSTIGLRRAGQHVAVHDQSLVEQWSACATFTESIDR